MLIDNQSRKMDERCEGLNLKFAADAIHLLCHHTVCGVLSREISAVDLKTLFV